MLKGVVRNLLGDAPLGDGSRFQEAQNKVQAPKGCGNNSCQGTLGVSGCRDIYPPTTSTTVGGPYYCTICDQIWALNYSKIKKPTTSV